MPTPVCPGPKRKESQWDRAVGTTTSETCASPTGSPAILEGKLSAVCPTPLPDVICTVINLCSLDIMPLKDLVSSLFPLARGSFLLDRTLQCPGPSLARPGTRSQETCLWTSSGTRDGHC